MRTVVFWDFGGVILSSPFEAFNRYEASRGLPKDIIRTINATNGDSNAWALLERSDITPDEFDRKFAEEAAERGHQIPGADVLALLQGDIRPEMVQALQRIKAAGLPQACLTNNVVSHGDGVTEHAQTERQQAINGIMAIFDKVVESSKVGCRKPETRFYEIACETMQADPNHVVFLDDLGINLKPAAALGMHTIKVVNHIEALRQLEAAVGLELL
jgi:putative hydrolase of the HAD superfamily